MDFGICRGRGTNKSPQLPRDDYKVLEQCLTVHGKCSTSVKYSHYYYYYWHFTLSCVPADRHAEWVEGLALPLLLSAPKPAGSWCVE